MLTVPHGYLTTYTKVPHGYLTTFMYFLNVHHRYLKAEGKWKLTSISSVKKGPKRAGNDRIGKAKVDT